MKITIAQRLHPFSHKNGAKFLLPRTLFSLQVFPTHLIFSDLEGFLEPFSLSFDFAGPLTDFTAELDLEQGVLRVFGMTRKGFMRYQVLVKEGQILLIMEKIPEAKLGYRCSSSEEFKHFSKGESLLIPLSLKPLDRVKSGERLSLGEHKAQEWEEIRRRLNFTEIFPLWLCLSQWTPLQDSREGDEGNYLLLEKCRQTMDRKERDKILESFQDLFLAAFEGVLVPRVYDTEFQGILPISAYKNRSLSPMPLLVNGAGLIRSLFFQESEGKNMILPCLPPQFHCGRMIGVKTSKNLTLDFEWTKKNLRYLKISSSTEEEVQLSLPKGICSCRMKKGRRILKKLTVDAQGNLILPLKANETIDLDRFE